MALPSITQDRFKEFLKGIDLSFDIDRDGDIRMGFPSFMVFVTVAEKYYRLHAGWRGEISTSQDYEAAIELCNELNANFFWPRFHVSSPDDNQISRIEMDYSVPNMEGFNDEQLEDHFDVFMRAIFTSCKKIAEALPHLVDWDDDSYDEQDSEG